MTGLTLMSESKEVFRPSSTSESTNTTSNTESASISSEDLARIQSNQSKAQAITQHIQSTRSRQESIANFLTMILQDITDDTILITMHQVFFQIEGKVIKHINHTLIAGLFAPFYRDLLIHYQVANLYEPLIDETSDHTIDGYIAYLIKLSQTYHNDIALDQQHITQLVVSILCYYHIINPQTDEKIQQTILTRILHDLFGLEHQVDINQISFSSSSH
jgi:hypothetical protein